MKLFTLKHKDKKCAARTGIIKTAHGDIETPTFMPVGTQAVVKTLDQRDLLDIDAQIILGNTYHLHLRPGEDLIAKLGGLHKFMNWNRPILTDSGGFQVFSLGAQKKNKKGEPLVKIDDDGVTFHSHIDGSKRRLDAEKSIEIQHKLGADIIMAFDECTPDKADKKYVLEALARTHHWAERSLNYHKKSVKLGSASPRSKQFLFGIIQGATDKKLREQSTDFICSLDFDGIAVGGESIGYNMKATEEILQWIGPILPQDKPHYTMGVGLNPTDLFTVVEHGIDMFDCVAPTRLARHGIVFTFNNEKKHRLNILNTQHTLDQNPIDPNCHCPTCQNYSKAYLHHLFKTQEITAMRLATLHNLFFYLNLMQQIRSAINNDGFITLKKQWC